MPEAEKAAAKILPLSSANTAELSRKWPKNASTVKKN